MTGRLRGVWRTAIAAGVTALAAGAAGTAGTAGTPDKDTAHA